MVNIQFYCRKCKTGKNGTAPVEVSINVDGNRSILTLPRKEDPLEFSKALSSRKDSDIKRYCEAVKRNFQLAITDMANAGIYPSKKILAEYARGNGVRKFTLEDLFSQTLSLQKMKVGKTTGERQYIKFEQVRDLFFDLFDRDMSAGQISPKDIDLFYLTISKKYANGTVHGMMVKLKKIFKVGFENGQIKSNPFVGFEMEKEKPREEWLTDADMEKVRNVRGSEAIERARDLFLFQCSSGISYADMEGLKEGDIHCENGVYSVCKTRCKTGIRYTSVILAEGVEILKKYNFNLPHVSVAKYNLNLLKIENMTGVGTHLHSHLGRKVYGCNLLRSGCSMKTVSRALGHSTTQVTESTYAFLRDADVVKEIAGKLAV